MSQQQENIAQTCVIPVFPLPNVVLFPKVHLPLHIFEPRYRQMVKDSMAGQRLIGIALLRGDWEKNYKANPDIYPIGCMGEIVSGTPLPDGRYNIVLYGRREYEIKEHILDQSPYRRAKVLLREEPEGLKSAFPASLRGEILNLVQRIMEGKESDLLKILSDSSLDEETWLSHCCFSFDASMLEKQSLLEAKSLEERAVYLLNLLHFQVVEMATPYENLRDSKERKAPH